MTAEDFVRVNLAADDEQADQFIEFVGSVNGQEVPVRFYQAEEIAFTVAVRFSAATHEEANSLACDIEQVLSGRDIVEFLGGSRVFPHDVQVERLQLQLRGATFSNPRD